MTKLGKPDVEERKFMKDVFYFLDEFTPAMQDRAEAFYLDQHKIGPTTAKSANK